MATTGFSDLYLACRNGDIAVVQRLLPVTSLEILNRTEPDGNTCLHAAASCGHKEIVRLLLARGAYRRVKDQYGKTPLEAAKTDEVEKLFSRSADASKQRFGINPAKQLEWQFQNDHAETFARAVHWGCIKDRGIKKTVEKIQQADILEDDGDPSNEVIKNYFKCALEKKDPLYLLRAYTTESQFYRRLNREMATGNDREVFKKLCRKWTGFYTGIIAKNPALDHLHFSGQTYRGMEITPADYQQYRIGIALANKSFQSTSKSWKIAKGFACPPEHKPGTIPVVLIFTITDRKSALSIDEISDFQYEEEVLIVPGTFFIVTDINRDQSPHEVGLRQLQWNDEF
ncbi:unnamed protein product [Rotaria magnacalcarata]|uniref:NAD(P)(+)--arginine ADP-ribosyltransferase n=1 Tax=Rotaria magnacalcarata TaxID=392030 RepID=A0A819KTX6_9BILA|nr:unnamed protein product [Rotaria magnacalcarata]CAF1618348.1 unnamed protein product [Rotaria magnacalcarata]CAF1970145.1 unnamed protein product [Rotaria magnacalcarata]CAF2012637.1 unnamed protein product [Rotaria magnacalcarata]CAF2132025.1 unnamed protein product [Rotaria magnacalcarata]